MKYKGIELKEVTEPQLFNPPKMMLVWDHYANIVELDVYAIVSRKEFPVICENSTWRHCAEIPEVAESKLVTNRELSRWLAQGHGEVCIFCHANTYWGYSVNAGNDDIPKGVAVRKWDETEWHKPTREYLGLEDN